MNTSTTGLIESFDPFEAPEASLNAAIARKSIEEFTIQTKPDYSPKWFHSLICSKLDDFANKRIKNLILNLPPQHGKSELVSRRLPAYLLGLNPELKIVSVSYSAPRARRFNRDVQRVIDCPEYRLIFPGTVLARSPVIKGQNGGFFVRNTDLFEIVEHGGTYFSVGVGGGLTGETVDVGIIDDPIKDAKEANSKLVRERVWEWYEDVFRTRLHNESQQLVIMTRWHEDDLAGRIISSFEKDPELEHWEVINLEAIKETDTAEDPRDPGEALWEERHSLDRLKKIKQSSPRTFYALYQGRPSPEKGDVIQSEWFGEFTPLDLIRAAQENKVDIIPSFFLDSSYEENKESGNDPSVILAGCKIGNFGYIMDVSQVWKDFPDLIRHVQEFLELNGYDKIKSKLYIEPKASGKSIAQQLRKKTTISVIDKLDFINLQDSKLVRALSVTPTIESRRILLPKQAPWKQRFLQECIHFPNSKYKDQVDVLVMFVAKFFTSGGGGFSWRTF